MLATHRVQDAFGLSHFRFDRESGRVIPIHGNGSHAASNRIALASDGATQTSVLVLREGQIYFQAAADELLHSSDEYLKTFLASAE